MHSFIETALDFLEVTTFSEEKKALANLGVPYKRSQYNKYHKACRKNGKTPLLFSKTQKDILKPLKKEANQMPVKKGFGFIETNMAVASPELVEKLNENYKMIAQTQGMDIYPVVQDVVCESFEYKSVKHPVFKISSYCQSLKVA